MASKVAVGCKVPTGIILHLEREGVDADSGTKRWFQDDTKEPVKVGGIYDERGFVTPSGYGVTMVDKDFWDQWLSQKKDHPLVKSGAIFAESTQARAEDKAAEQSGDVKTGLEGVNADKPGKGLEPVK